MATVSPKARRSRVIAERAALPLAMAVWWIGVIDKSGQIQYMEYLKLSSCQTMQRTLSKAFKVTSCTWKEESHDLDRLSSRSSS